MFGKKRLISTKLKLKINTRIITKDKEGVTEGWRKLHSENAGFEVFRVIMTMKSSLLGSSENEASPNNAALQARKLYSA